jgi:hypothetical protein
MIAQFIDAEGTFEVSHLEDPMMKEDISNGEMVKNKSKISMNQADRDLDQNTLDTIAKCLQTQAGINNQERTLLDVAEAEAMIEGDFIVTEMQQ